MEMQTNDNQDMHTPDSQYDADLKMALKLSAREIRQDMRSEHRELKQRIKSAKKEMKQ